jgi:hypothetical protein
MITSRGLTGLYIVSKTKGIFFSTFKGTGEFIQFGNIPAGVPCKRISKPSKAT